MKKKKTYRNKAFFGIIVAAFICLAIGSFFSTEAATCMLMAGFMFPLMRDTGEADTGGDPKAAEKRLLESLKSELESFKTGELIPTLERLKHIETKADAITKDVADMEDLRKNISDACARVKALMENGELGSFSGSTKSATKTIAEAFVKQFHEAVKNGDIAKLINKEKPRVSWEIKAAGTMTTANITPVGTNAIPFTLADIEPGFTRIVRRRPFILTLVNIGRTNSKFVQWIEQANPDPGAAGTTSEGSAKTQTDFDAVEKSARVEKITAYIKVSKEMLDDVGFIESEINNELIELIRLKMDEQVLSGDGVTPNLNGILTVAPTFTGGGLANTIASPNNFDVLRAAISEIMNFNFFPTDIIMHPEDVAAMDLTKDGEDRYLLPPFISNSGSQIKGVPITTNTGVDAGTFLVADMTKSNVRVREDVMLSVGYENDDFTKNIITILGEMRGVHYIKTNHLKAFIQGDFATAKTALLAP